MRFSQVLPSLFWDSVVSCSWSFTSVSQVCSTSWVFEGSQLRKGLVQTLQFSRSLLKSTSDVVMESTSWASKGLWLRKGLSVVTVLLSWSLLLSASGGGMVSTSSTLCSPSSLPHCNFVVLRITSGLNFTCFLSVHVSAEELEETGPVHSWSVEAVTDECFRIPQGATGPVCLSPDPSTSAVQSWVLKVSTSFVAVGVDVVGVGVGVGSPAGAFWGTGLSLRICSNSWVNKVLPEGDAKGPRKENTMKMHLAHVSEVRGEFVIFFTVKIPNRRAVYYHFRRD